MNHSSFLASLKSTILRLSGSVDRSSEAASQLSVAELAVLFDKALLEHQAADSFLDTGRFPWVKRLESRIAGLEAETQQLLRVVDAVPPFGDIQELQKPLSGNGWRVFPFLVYGHSVDWAHQHFPKTSELISEIPDCVTAMYSILQPGQHLQPHTGPSSAVLRYHLATYVPQPELCAIRVADQQRSWRQGNSLILNDYRNHEAWNKGDLPRVVLFVDFKRPVPEKLEVLRDQVINGFATDAFAHEIVENFKRWIDAYGDTIAASGQVWDKPVDRSQKPLERV